MASDDQSVPSHGSKPPARVVASAFVSVFYKFLQQSPHHVNQFYKESSRLGRPDPHGEMDCVMTLSAIKQKILAMDYRELTTDIIAVDAQESLDGSVIVLVMGSLTRTDTKKKFAQSFLAPQEKGYFVLNDIFRYVDEKDQSLLPPQSQSERVPARRYSDASRQSIPAQVVGNAFVQKYYMILDHSPQLVHRFYLQCSMLGRPDPHGIMELVTTMEAIKENIRKMNLEKSDMKIKTVDAQESLCGGITVLVTGSLTGKDGVKDFIQLFFLAPQKNGYFILNDIFRYVNNGDHQLVNVGLLNGRWNYSHLNEDGCIPSAPVEPNPLHHESNALAASVPNDSPVPEDVQLTMAINASIQSAIAEGVPVNLNAPDITSKLEPRDPREGSSNSDNTLKSCVICLDAQVEGACIPCGHMAGCMSCLNKIKRKKWGCPVCRAKIAQVVRIYAV